MFPRPPSILPSAALALVVLAAACHPAAPPPPRPIANDTKILITRGPVILRTPGLPAIVIRTPQDPPPGPLPPDVSSDPDLTTITVPPGTLITRNVGGDPKSLKITADQAHANQDISVIGAGDLIYNLDLHAERP